MKKFKFQAPSPSVSSPSVFFATIIFAFSILHASEGQFQTQLPKEKSKSVAVNWSMGATLFPIMLGVSGFSFVPAQGVLVCAGIAFGPSMGHFYAHQWLRGFATTGLRIGLGYLGAMAGLYSLYSIEFDDASPVFFLVSIGSAAGIIGSVIYDWATAPASVQKYNEGLKTKFDLNFVPNIDIKEKKYGLSVVYNF